MEDEEISVSLVVMNQFHSDLILSMSKRAVNIVFTIAAIIGVVCTKLSLILLEAVQLFHLVVRSVAFVSPWTHEVIIFILNVLNIYTSTF